MFISAVGKGHGVLPGQVDLLHGPLPHLVQVAGMAQGPLQKSRHGLSRLIDDKAVAVIRDPLGRAGIPDQDTGQPAGRRLADDQAVGIKGRREQKEVRPGIPGPELVAVIDRPGKNALCRPAFAAHKPQLPRPALQQLPVRPLADKDHAEVLSLVRQHLQGVQDDRKTLVGDQAANIEPYRHPVRQIIALRDLFHLLLIDAASGKIHPVGHDPVIPLKAQRLQALPCAPADHPDIVTGLDVFDHGPDPLLGDRPDLHLPAQVDVIFRVISKNDRGAGRLAQDPGHDGRRGRAVGMDDIRLKIRHFRDRPAGDRISRAVTVHHRRGIKAGIGHDPVGVGTILPSRISGRPHHDLRPVIPHQIICIIHDHIDSSVNDRRKGFIQQTDLHFLPPADLLCHTVILRRHRPAAELFPGILPPDHAQQKRDRDRHHDQFRTRLRPDHAAEPEDPVQDQ